MGKCCLRGGGPGGRWPVGGGEGVAEVGALSCGPRPVAAAVAAVSAGFPS